MTIQRIQLLSRVDQSESEAVRFCGLTRKQTEHIFGLSTYVQKYGEMNDEVHLNEHHEEFNDWRVEIPFDITNVTILCCPEDMHCDNDVQHSRDTCCPQCVAPLCTECENSLRKRTPELPQASLMNDMMIVYAPTELYKLNATVMEMICASVCITSMICFTLENTSEGIDFSMRKHTPINLEWLREAMPRHFLCLGMICYNNYKQMMTTHQCNIVSCCRVLAKT
jgi:hypothetical protein